MKQSNDSLPARWWWWLLLLLLGEVRERGASPIWCTPKLWESKEWALHITYTERGPELWEIESQFSVDVIGNRFASLESGTGSGKDYTIFNLFYFDANTLYTVQDGRCNTTRIDGNITQHCIDIPTKDAVEYLKESWGGDNMYQIVSAGVRTLSPDGVGRFDSVDLDTPSVPLVKEIHGVIAGVPTYRMSSYYNVTYGIRDPSIFTPPQSCIST